MLFPTYEYAIFFSICFFIVWSLGDNNFARKIFLIAASWVFYGFWDVRFVVLLFGSGLFNWYIGEKLIVSQNPQIKKNWLKFGIIINIGLLGIFKYFGFFSEQLLEILNNFGFGRDIKIIEILLPIAISFFTFQSISYIVDIYYSRFKTKNSLLDLILLTSFFPHLVAGPIVRGRDIFPQFQTVPKPSREFFAWGALLIIWGLFKKCIIASYLATEFVDPIFFDVKSQSSLNLWLGIYAYAVQIYCDFSAYSNIAIGSAALLGYRFCQNFDQPYKAKSLQDFWRRWHISLSLWLRDYLYIPLGGSRGSDYKTNKNLMTTMVLGGLWHGANWGFIIWGFIHGIALIIERIFKNTITNFKMPNFIGIIITFHIVCLAWIFFRAADFQNATDYIIAMFGQDGVSSYTPYIIFLILLGLMMNFAPKNSIEKIAKASAKLNPFLFSFFIFIGFLLTEAMRSHGVEPFIYFQF